MSEDRTAPKSGEARQPYQKVVTDSYYGLLGVHPSASMRDIRQAYRDLSKLYHPDTTKLPTAIATAKFQQLNEAYATLSNPERRGVYDRKIGYSKVAVIQPLPNLSTAAKQPRKYQSSAYLDPTDRPLSPGELFALFILGITFIGCLCLAIMIGLTRGEALLQPEMVQNDTVQSIVRSDSGTVRSTVPSLNRGSPIETLNPVLEQKVASPKRPEEADKTVGHASSSVQSKDFESGSRPSGKTGVGSQSSTSPQLPKEAPVASPIDSLPDTLQPIQS